MSIQSRSHQYGTVFENWQILELLGQGSGGKTAVFRLKRIDSNRGQSALKVINLIEERGDFDSMPAYLKKEYEAAREDCKTSALQEVWLMDDFQGNTNIVDYLDHKFVDWTDESGFGCDMLIRMELLKDLRSEIRSGKTFTEAEVIKIGCDICQALILCHDNGILHRDIKPENIFVNRNGNFKLGDFGISRIISNAPMSMASTGIGTPEYAAPEQTSGKYDKRVDIYSLGLVLYELSNQHHLPFARSTYVRPDDVNKRMVGVPFPAPTKASNELGAIILKACAFTPSERYQTAQELLDALSNVNTTSETVRNSDPIADTPPKRADQLFEEKLKAFMIEAPEDPHVVSGAADNPYMTAPALGDNSAPDGYATVPATSPASTEHTGYETEPAAESPVEHLDDYSANDLKQLRMCQEAAEQGDAEAQYELACHYRVGFGTLIEANPAEAAKWYQEAAARGHIDAQVELAYCYITGRGVNEDEKQGSFWFLEAAKKGSARAQYEYGCRSRHGMTDKEKRTWLKKAADQEYIPAILELAHHYEQLDKPAYDQVIFWYEKAIALGDVSAMIYLGELYFDGEKITADYGKAYELFSQAAEADTYQKGNAQWYMGECYYYGLGVERDETKAVMWFAQASENKATLGYLSLANCYYYGRGVPVDYAKAFSLYERYDDVEFAQAMVAECYYFGRGVEQNYEKAVEICLSIEDHFDLFDHAKLVLGLCYINGVGISQNISKGFKLLSSCDINSTTCHTHNRRSRYSNSKTDMPIDQVICAEVEYELGRCLYRGIGIPQNSDKAVAFLERSAKSGCPKAMMLLAQCYKEGHGSNATLSSALEWMHYASIKNCPGASDLLASWIEDLKHRNQAGDNAALGDLYALWKDLSSAADYYEKAATQGDVSSQNTIGQYYAVGMGRQKDLYVAATWFKKAANQKHADAEHHLKQCLKQMPLLLRMKWKSANRS